MPYSGKDKQVAYLGFFMSVKKPRPQVGGADENRKGAPGLLGTDTPDESDGFANDEDGAGDRGDD